MFQRVKNLILAIAGAINLSSLTPEKIREAILAALNALAEKAAATPTFFDDLLIRAAILFVESDVAWKLLLALILRKSGSVACAERQDDLADDDIEYALAVKFEAITHDTA
jgi:hypothetical protein